MSTDPTFRTDEAFALELDAKDPLSVFRDRFLIPRRRDGTEAVYLAGNSLGLQPRTAADAVRQELDDWARFGVDGHFEAMHPWYRYHEGFRESCAGLVGARPHEVVVMNGLTVNLHLMMVSLYRPRGPRYKILVEDSAFPSDSYAVKTQMRFHGYDPEQGLIVARPEPGQDTIEPGRFEALIEEHRDSLALVLIGGVNYYTGQAFDLKSIASCAAANDCVVGIDLAHAVGNLELSLHEWNVDFAVWCSYKYLNAGPGAVAGCFVHEKHHARQDIPRFGGWWGNDPENRFRMHLEPEFRPVQSADGWQLSNPPILALAPLRASLQLFDEAGLPALRSRSRRLTAYLEQWVASAGERCFRQITPRDPDLRGAQLSLLALDRPRPLFEALQAAGVVGDYREPNVIRLAPVPLYNSFHDIWRFGQVLRSWSDRTGN